MGSVEYYQIHLFIVYDAFFRVTLINWAGSIRNENSCYVGLWEIWFYNDAWPRSPWILDSEATQADVVRQKYGRGYLCGGVSSIEQFGLLVFRGRCFGATLLQGRNMGGRASTWAGALGHNSAFVRVIRPVSLLWQPQEVWVSWKVELEIKGELRKQSGAFTARSGSSHRIVNSRW